MCLGKVVPTSSKSRCKSSGAGVYLTLAAGACGVLGQPGEKGEDGVESGRLARLLHFDQ